MKNTKTYMIVQYADSGDSQVILRGLSLNEAKMETLTSSQDGLAYMREIGYGCNIGPIGENPVCEAINV